MAEICNIFLRVVPCCLVEVHQRFARTYCFYLHDRKVGKKQAARSKQALTMEAVTSSESHTIYNDTSQKAVASNSHSRGCEKEPQIKFV
jgi:hypothetical protein